MSEERYVDGPPAGAEGWREVWREDRQFRARASKLDFLLNFIRRLVHRSVEAETERQKNFNVALLDLVGDLRNDVAKARGELKADIATVQADVRSADEALAVELKKIRELIPVAAKRNDALIAALDQKIETVAVRVRDGVNPTVAKSPDFVYRRLEDGLRGSEAHVRQSAGDYVELARDHQPLVDVGCGRGELLAACREAGVDARGFDTNERSVADLQARGFVVALAGVPECFAKTENESVGSVAAIHVVEHLEVADLFALFAESARVLRKGGLLMIETPNAESIAVAGSEFWRDPTHLAPRHPAALTLLAREHGFDVADMRPVHPFPDAARLSVGDDDSPSLRRIVDALNERLFGGQDLRAVFRKR
jgi:SAM-dependent methyltransferase